MFVFARFTLLRKTVADRCRVRLLTELFQVGPRPIAMAFGSMANWGGNFIVGMTFPILQSLIGQYSFLLFATSTFFLALFLR
jgi:hypothetical protein